MNQKRNLASFLICFSFIVLVAVVVAVATLMPKESSFGFMQTLDALNATNATSSATNATSSATNATSSATNATSSATNATILTCYQLPFPKLNRLILPIQNKPLMEKA